jgi:hypothetical protein
MNVKALESFITQCDTMMINRESILGNTYSIANEGMFGNIISGTRDKIKKFIEYIKDLIVKYSKIIQAKIAEMGHKNFKLTPEHVDLLGKAFLKTGGRETTYEEVVLPLADDLQAVIVKLYDIKKVNTSDKSEVDKFMDELYDSLAQIIDDAEVSETNDNSGIVDRNIKELEDILEKCIAEHKKDNSEKTESISPDKVINRIKMIQENIDKYRKTITEISKYGNMAEKLFTSSPVSKAVETFTVKVLNAINKIVSLSIKRLASNQRAYSLELRIYTSFM